MKSSSHPFKNVESEIEINHLKKGFPENSLWVILNDTDKCRLHRYTNIGTFANFLYYIILETSCLCSITAAVE